MSKLNPLFVDSTKGFGESVGTRIELSGVEIHDGETVTARIQDNFGRDQSVVLTLENGIYAGRIWLTHQQLITYEFFISRDGIRLASSTPRQIQATHMIIDQWHPQRELEQIVEQPAQEPNQKLATKGDNSFYKVFPETDSFEELIEKWGL